MNYELVKELKDNGFPQGDWGSEGKYWSEYDGGASKKEPLIIDSKDVNFGFMEDVYYIPNLSELIEVCGEKFGSLEKTINGWAAMTPDITSQAQLDNPSVKITRAVDIFVIGSTPEEAVAVLYIAIHKQIKLVDPEEGK